MTGEATLAGVAARLAAVRARIAAAEVAAGRAAGSVRLVAVSKGHARALARAALDAGHRLFGENRVQESMSKWPELRAAFPDARLHLIGPLQTNKAREAVALFDAIETVDRPKLAAALAREFERSGRRPDVFIEINTGAEPQKAGVPPDAADAFIRACIDDYALPVKGLMCIPPMGEEPAMHFALLASIAGRNGLAGLSMGMSADFETAIKFGATLVRVGAAIFGDRPGA